MDNEPSSRKQEILQAAQQEFIKEGFAGARMQRIADHIGVTKAMIHYYFKTKQHLFEEVFQQASENTLSGLLKSLEEEDGPLFNKIELLIDQLISRFEQYPDQINLIISGLEQNSEITSAIFKDACTYEAPVFNRQLKEAAENHSIIPTAPGQVIANILSLCMFPYSSRRLLQLYLNFEEEDDYGQWLKERKEIIKDVIINWLAG
jgi:AcrR family transcriptional regulator